MKNEKYKKTLAITPSIIVPDKNFLIGAVYGMNAARRMLEENPQPIVPQEINEFGEQQDGLYLGHWLELTCGKCGALYTFDDPNLLPEENLKCTIEGCDNHVIVYGIGDPRIWMIGQVKFI